LTILRFILSFVISVERFSRSNIKWVGGQALFVSGGDVQKLTEYLISFSFA